MPQVEAPPADTARHFLPPATDWGAVTSGPTLPSPSWPYWSRPQHRSEPSPGSRQPCSPPLDSVSGVVRRLLRSDTAEAGSEDWAADCTDDWALAVAAVDTPAPAGAARAIGVNRLAIRAMRATCAFMATSDIDVHGMTGNFCNICHGSSQIVTGARP